MLNCKFILCRIAYVYCTDTILDQNNKLTQDITVQSIERVISEGTQKKKKKEPKQTTLETFSMKASPTKSSTRHSIMDTEGITLVKD